MIDAVKNLLDQQKIPLWKLIVKERDSVQYRSNGLVSYQDGVAVPSHFPRDANITIFLEYFRYGRKYLGQASFQFTEPFDEATVLQNLDKAHQEALLDESPWFSPRLKSRPLKAKSLSSFGKKDLASFLQPIHEACQRGCVGPQITLQEEFIHLEKESVIYLDSFGEESVQISHRGRIEIDLATDTGETQTVSSNFSEFGPEKITRFVQEACHRLHSRTGAQPFTGSCPQHVYLRGNLVPELFAYVFRQLSGREMFSGQSLAEAGKKLWGLDQPVDLISMEALPSLYDSPFSEEFDQEGVTLEPFEMVKDSLVCGFRTDQATAHYLGLPLRGQPKNFSVAPGTLKLGDFDGQPYLEIVEVKTFQIDDLTGNLTAHVDLAYYFDGKTNQPVTGLVLQGNLRAILTESRFSSEIWTWEYYEGPELIQISPRFISTEV